MNVVKSMAAAAAVGEKKFQDDDDVSDRFRHNVLTINSDTNAMK
jgi:hypothetical protein